MTDKPTLKSVKTEAKPGHADTLCSPETLSRPLILSTQVNSVKEAVELAEDLGLWFAAFSQGCVSPRELLEGVRQGKPLWQILHGDPLQLKAAGQINQQTQDIVSLQVMDPLQAIAQLERRSEDAQTCADRIRQLLANPEE